MCFVIGFEEILDYRTGLDHNKKWAIGLNGSGRGASKLLKYLPDLDVCVRVFENGCESIWVEGSGKWGLLLVSSSPDLDVVGD